MPAQIFLDLRLRIWRGRAGQLNPRGRAAVAVERLVEASPDVTLAELQAELQRRFGLVAGLSTIHQRSAASAEA